METLNYDTVLPPQVRKELLRKRRRLRLPAVIFLVAIVGAVIGLTSGIMSSLKEAQTQQLKKAWANNLRTAQPGPTPPDTKQVEADGSPADPFVFPPGYIGPKDHEPSSPITEMIGDKKYQWIQSDNPQIGWHWVKVN